MQSIPERDSTRPSLLHFARLAMVLAACLLSCQLIAQVEIERPAAAEKGQNAQRDGAVQDAESAKPLALHPANPHYFLFRGKPAVLITAGEHYGAVLNLDFDYIPYLDELKSKGFNLTRTFSGSYREVTGSFGIDENTLAPAQNRYSCPWARSSTPGAADGGHKFDLTKWDAAYFKRLKDFVGQAGRRGIVVELVFFCTMYDEKLWKASPMHASNNVNDIGDVGQYEVYTFKDKKLLAAQETMVRKIVSELKDFDNVYYEICNEPYERGGFEKEWNDRIVAAIVDAESAFPAKHLIAQGIAVRAAKIEEPNPQVSVFNFHAATPDSVTLNYNLNKVIADDETGGKGESDVPYRKEGWEFIVAGGGVYSHLDFSFTCKHPDGSGKVTTAPGGGDPALRGQLKILKEFIEEFDFIRMRPNNEVIKGGKITSADSNAAADIKKAARILSEPGKAYAIYLNSGNRAELALELPAGSYKVEWVNTKTGSVDKTELLQHGGGETRFVSPKYVDDIAVRVVNQTR